MIDLHQQLQSLRGGYALYLGEEEMSLRLYVVCEVVDQATLDPAGGGRRAPLFPGWVAGYSQMPITYYSCLRERQLYTPSTSPLPTSLYILQAMYHKLTQSESSGFVHQRELLRNHRWRSTITSDVGDVQASTLCHWTKIASP